MVLNCAGQFEIQEAMYHKFSRKSFNSAYKNIVVKKMKNYKIQIKEIVQGTPQNCVNVSSKNHSKTIKRGYIVLTVVLL